MKKEKIIIIDSSSVIYRAFYALPPLKNKKGELVNAVYGFLLVFLKAIKEFQPDFIATCFDLPSPTFRHKKFKGYKAKRPPTPKDLYSQIPRVKKVLKAFNVSTFEKKGFEADDLIGTISKFFIQKKKKPQVIILSGDLDLLQLVDEFTKVYLLKKGVKNTLLYNEEMVREKYSGLRPLQLTDYRGLRGDVSDNIPGVSGVGEKTAIKLLNEFHNIEKLYNQLEKKKDLKTIKPRIKELLLQQKKQAFLSKDLAEIRRNVPITIALKKCRWQKYDKSKVVKTLNGMGFQSLLKRLPGFEIKKEERKLKLW